jgi:hypothetical protein
LPQQFPLAERLDRYLWVLGLERDTDVSHAPYVASGSDEGFRVVIRQFASCLFVTDESHPAHGPCRRPGQAVQRDAVPDDPRQLRPRHEAISRTDEYNSGQQDERQQEQPGPQGDRLTAYRLVGHYREYPGHTQNEIR